MKKLMFTAIALIAFSGVSLANTIDLEEKEEVGRFPCTEQWKEDIGVLQNAYGATFEEACIIADRCFEECLDALYGN
ncbi:hypothetical protein [Flavobacterium sp.]|jgi:hypothetical protein|uniref:hypothetical protein n=1 Tax=Flavobacterium sp. TaxID=239 RepID=UPI0037C0C5CF